MELTFEELCEIVSVFVDEKVSAFKIGKTDDIEEREKADEYKDWVLKELINGDADKITRLEKKLIKHFINNPKCKNELEGSSGNPDADTLYIALYRPITSEEYGEKLLGSIMKKFRS